MYGWQWNWVPCINWWLEEKKTWEILNYIQKSYITCLDLTLCSKLSGNSDWNHTAITERKRGKFCNGHERQCNWTCIPFAESATEVKKLKEQAGTEGRCSKCLSDLSRGKKSSVFKYSILGLQVVIDETNSFSFYFFYRVSCKQNLTHMWSAMAARFCW